MEVLLVLARRSGQTVTKDDLFAAAWPNIFVHEDNLKVTVSALRRALRNFCPAEAYIVTVVHQGYRFVADPEPVIPEQHADIGGPAEKSLPQLGTIIGRENELGELRESLCRTRLTTIVGPGGVGKTTVAVAAAQLHEHGGGGSAYFVDLARVASEEFVPASLAAALGVNPGSNDILRAVVSILVRRKIVLLLDNCEHVLNAVTRIAEQILSNTPHVQILATSRQPLRAHGEQVFWLAPLAVPPRDDCLTASDVLRYSAPQLLTARVLEKTGYRVKDVEATAIAQICRRLDGLPLALELVSSRLAQRSPAAVLAELDNQFGFLKSGSFTGPGRQKTLLATLEWSYALLSKNEAAVLRAISIFSGSFDIDSVVWVVTQHVLSSAETVDAVGGLHAKSMLGLEQTPSGLQYRLLDSTRAFAFHLLNSQGERRAVSERHAHLQLAVLARVAAECSILSTSEWRAAYGGQADDLRKALDWSFDRSADALLGVRLVVAALPFWDELSLVEERCKNCERALERFARVGCTDASLNLRLVVGLAVVHTYISAESVNAATLFETAIQLARKISDPDAECRVLAALAHHEILRGRLTAATKHLEAMKEISLRRNDRSALLEQQQLVSTVEVLRGDVIDACSRLESLVSAIREHAGGALSRFQVQQKANVEVSLGAVLWLVGQPGRAARLTETAAREALLTGHGLTLIYTLSRGICATSIWRRDFKSASFYVDKLREVVYRHGVAAWVPIADCLKQVVDNLSEVRQSPKELWSAFDNLRLASAEVRQPPYIAMLADAMISIGQVDDAAQAVDLAMEIAEGTERQRWILPELLRVRAAIERARGDDGDAEATLRESMRIAEDVGCLGWTLRSALHLSFLLLDQGRRDEGQHVLKSVYERFNDGFDSGDLRDAGQLLDRLRSL